MKNKNVYIIAGPNGAGKTTFATMFLPDYVKCEKFINADLIATGLSPFSPSKASIKAGKIVLDQIREYIASGVEFAFETTMAGMTYLKYCEMLKKNGYVIHIFFLWIPSKKLAIARVENRVAQGGHSVPDQDIRRRFDRSIENFFKRYSLLSDEWLLFDNSQSKPEIIAKKHKLDIKIINVKLFESIISELGIKFYEKN